ncbi:MAG: VOC family protein, partial [Phycisphaerae bacterium]|nr:VOC family protein [Saprospiraceae bacterium]
MANMQKINPFLWFDHQAEEAANFYTSVFNNAQTGDELRTGGAVLVKSFSLDGQKFSALNGGPQFKLNPTISFYVVFETEAETDSAWQKLAEGGMVMMPLQQYPWSAKYGWVQDRYGLSWQLSLGKIEDVGQKFTPLLMFCGPQQGRATEAVQFYTSLFSDSSIKGIMHYEAGEPRPESQVKHAQFTLNGQTFMAMDSGVDQPFTFNEALSFVVNCETQEEVDFFWNKLTADGGEESQCGWLKDKFGVSWQITPEILPRLLSDPNPAVAQRAMAAMMKMRKIEIAKLTEAPADAKTAITVETTVNAPIEKVWRLWTEAEHIQNWNNASDDWHTPKAVNDLRKGGNFTFTMAARDGSVSFDFGGVFDEVIENQHIAYTLG